MQSLAEIYWPMSILITGVLRHGPAKFPRPFCMKSLAEAYWPVSILIIGVLG